MTRPKEEPTIPQPTYKCMYGSLLLYTYTRGKAKEAIKWLSGRGPEYAVFSVIDGQEREVLRGEVSR